MFKHTNLRSLIFLIQSTVIPCQGKLSTPVDVSGTETGVLTNQLNQVNLFQIGAESPSNI